MADVDHTNQAVFSYKVIETALSIRLLKHGGGKRRVSPDHLELAIEAPAEDMLALSEALDQLEREYPRKHQLVMLRFFAGLTEAEAAVIIGVNERTVQRAWRFVRAWLYETLSDTTFVGVSEPQTAGDVDE